MFGSSRLSGANAYANVGMETGVIAADPYKLIVMLFDGAILATSDALQFMDSGDILQKGKSISRGISIIESGLRASLDKNAGGEIAENLDALYDYMVRRLLEANLNNNRDYLLEVQKLLKELKGAWESIAPAAKNIESVQHKKSASPYDALQPRTSNHIEA